MKHTISLIALMSVFVASSALANDMHSSKAHKMDSNRDGVVSQSERDAHMQDKMAQADKDRNGTVSHEEWATYNVSKKDQFAFAGQREDNNRIRYQYKDLPLVDMDHKFNKWNNYAPASGSERDSNRDYNRDYNR